eukprot:jgi/Botrbrau1/20100/Bobra.0173s0004.1
MPSFPGSFRRQRRHCFCGPHGLWPVSGWPFPGCGTCASPFSSCLAIGSPLKAGGTARPRRAEKGVTSNAYTQGSVAPPLEREGGEAPGSCPVGESPEGAVDSVSRARTSHKPARGDGSHGPGQCWERSRGRVSLAGASRAPVPPDWGAPCGCWAGGRPSLPPSEPPSAVPLRVSSAREPCPAAAARPRAVPLSRGPLSVPLPGEPPFLCGLSPRACCSVAAPRSALCSSSFPASASVSGQCKFPKQHFRGTPVCRTARGQFGGRPAKAGKPGGGRVPSPVRGKLLMGVRVPAPRSSPRSPG